MPAAGILEEGDVGSTSSAPDCTAGQIIEIAQHVGFVNGAARDRLQDVAHAMEGGFAAIDEDERATGRLVVGLPRFGGISADEVEMGAGLEMGTLDERLMRTRAGGDD